MSHVPSADERPPLDIGIVCAGNLSALQQRIIAAAIQRLEAALADDFSRFNWVVHVKQRRDIGEFSREESSHLLRLAADERDIERWDFALLVSGDELIAHYRRFALAALSRPLDAAVLSIARLQGRDRLTTVAGAADTDTDTVAARLASLMLQAIAHLGGLTEPGGAADPVTQTDSPLHLDTLMQLAPAQIDELQTNFANIADTRLEDEHSGTQSSLAFQLRASWINRSEIVDALLAARPWQFPRHLNRLTTAAVSTVAVLLMTAESWDLGLSLSPLRLAITALLIWLLTTAFVLTRQKLLLSRHQQLREQIVVTRVSATLIVLAGLAVTWLAIGALALLAAAALFDPELIRSWAASTASGANAQGPSTYLKMATFCASIGLLIGSLGASFEDQHHIQHVVFVDEEL